MATAASSKSIRYQRLLECIPMVLEKCHTQLDVENVIQMCYGDDKTDDNSNEIFCTMLHNILLQFHADVTNDVVAFLQQRNVEEKFRRLEAIIRKVDFDIEEQEKAKQRDKESAEAAINKVKMLKSSDNNNSDALSPQDMVQYQSYQQMMKMKEKLQKEIAEMESNVQQLQTEKDQHFHQMKTIHLPQIDAIQMELEKSADVCSMVQ